MITLNKRRFYYTKKELEESGIEGIVRRFKDLLELTHDCYIINGQLIGGYTEVDKNGRMRYYLEAQTHTEGAN